MIKLLLGGSPCTYWSVAQKNNREIEANGMGWELFKNYLIAKDKFRPDFFLYENNKSAAQAIKDQISHELDAELMYINSALVSAQNRQRFYVFNWTVDMPEDRGILLKDILENGTDLMQNDKSFCLTATYGGAVPWNTLERAQRTMVAIPVSAVGVGYRNRREKDGELYRRFETHGEAKANALTTVTTDSMVAVPIRVGEIEPGGQGNRIYSVDGKSIAQTATSGGIGSNTGLYAIPLNTTTDGKAQCLRATCYKDGIRNLVANDVDKRTCVAVPADKSTEKEQQIYEVKGGLITIRGKEYPIKLPDGFYIIRKLTPIECERLQTMPDNYTACVSKTQRYKGLGNGWTAETIIHVLNGALKDVPKSEEIVVLSMYDGIGTGRYCLDKMGFTNVKYFASEIDKYAIKVSTTNYPDIVQIGDAFDVRKPGWGII